MNEKLKRVVAELYRPHVEADASAAIPDEVHANPFVAFEGDDEMLTSEQAAKLLNLSRPHLNKLLDKGLIIGMQRLDGGHRRISKGAVLRYKAEMKQRQAHASDEVVRLTDEMGLYKSELDGIPEAPKSR
jgi:excisionase family DNA binding protein